MTTQEKMTLWGQVYAAVIGVGVTDKNYVTNAEFREGLRQSAAIEAIEVAEQVEKKLKDGPPPPQYMRNIDEEI